MRIKLLVLFIFQILLLKGEEVRVSYSLTTPPYVFENGTGIVVDIISESLAQKGHIVKPVFVSIARGFQLFKEGKIDATSIYQKNSGVVAYHSGYFIQYQNVAIALKNRQCKINAISDLYKYNVIAFQNAHKYLGKEFRTQVEVLGKDYSEIHDQKLQVLKLLKGRTEVVIMDRHIFTYYKNMLISEEKVSADIQTELFELFPPTKYRVAFKDKTLQEDFDLGMHVLKKSGRYEQIYDYYSTRYMKMEK